MFDFKWCIDELAVITSDIINKNIDVNSLAMSTNTKVSECKDWPKEVINIANKILTSNDGKSLFYREYYNELILNECIKCNNFYKIGIAIWTLEILIPYKPYEIQMDYKRHELNSNYSETGIKVFFKEYSSIRREPKRHNLTLNDFLKKMVVIFDSRIDKYFISSIENVGNIKIMVNTLGRWPLNTEDDFEIYVSNDGTRTFKKKEFSANTENEIIEDIISSIKKAILENVTIFIAPEMMGNKNIVTKITMFLNSQNLNSLKLCVLPSVSDNGENVCYIWTPESVGLHSQKKITPYILSKGNLWYKENIHAIDANLNVFDIKGIGSVAVMLCVDYLVDKLYNVYRDAGVNLIIVPSMSYKSDSFISTMEKRTDDGIATIHVNQCSFCKYDHVKFAVALPTSSSQTYVCDCDQTVKNCEFCSNYQHIFTILISRKMTVG